MTTAVAGVVMLVTAVVVAVLWVRGHRACTTAGEASATVDDLTVRVNILVQDVAYLRESLVTERRAMASHLTDHAATNALRLKARREGHE